MFLFLAKKIRAYVLFSLKKIRTLCSQLLITYKRGFIGIYHSLIYKKIEEEFLISFF